MQHDVLALAFKMLLAPLTFVDMSRGRSGNSGAHLNDLLAAQP